MELTKDKNGNSVKFGDIIRYYAPLSKKGKYMEWVVVVDNYGEIGLCDIEDAIKYHPNYPQEIINGGAQVTDSIIVGNIKDLIYDNR
jgi:hypothetical protein